MQEMTNWLRAYCQLTCQKRLIRSIHHYYWVSSKLTALRTAQFGFWRVICVIAIIVWRLETFSVQVGLLIEAVHRVALYASYLGTYFRTICRIVWQLTRLCCLCYYLGFYVCGQSSDLSHRAGSILCYVKAKRKRVSSHWMVQLTSSSRNLEKISNYKYWLQPKWW